MFNDVLSDVRFRDVRFANETKGAAQLGDRWEPDLVSKISRSL